MGFSFANKWGNNTEMLFLKWTFILWNCNDAVVDRVLLDTLESMELYIYTFII